MCRPDAVAEAKKNNMKTNNQVTKAKEETNVTTTKKSKTNHGKCKNDDDLNNSRDAPCAGAARVEAVDTHAEMDHQEYGQTSKNTNHEQIDNHKKYVQTNKQKKGEEAW